MNKLRHSKFKNTGILFELLVRQTASDVLSENDSNLAIPLIKKYFKGKNKPLGKELGLYKCLMNEKFLSESKAKELIDATIEARRRISNVRLKREKYNLIKEIKENFDIDEFFRNKLNDYKYFASIYKLFEAETNDDCELSPSEFVKCRYSLIEHITNKSISVDKKISEEDKAFVELSKQTEDVKALAYKMMLDKFNEKYQHLNKHQKDLLREYIYNVSNTNQFREYVNKDVDVVKAELDEKVSKIKDKATRIKIQGITEHIEKLKQGKVVKEDQLVQLMRYFELVKEIDKAIESPKEKING